MVLHPVTPEYVTPEVTPNVTNRQSPDGGVTPGIKLQHV